MAKLNKDTVETIIQRKRRGLSSRLIAQKLGVSKRRIDQVWKHYRRTGKRVLIRKPGKQSCDVTQQERTLIMRVQQQQGCGARLIAALLRRKYKKRIGHTRVHMMLLDQQLATPNKNKQGRRKPWVFYERKHSLSLGHIDWHPCAWRNGYACVVLDDASRKILAGCEAARISSRQSITLVKQVLQCYGNIRRIEQILTDRGSEFYATLKKKAVMKGQSDFERFLEREGIQHILCRYKHPQTNGKLERWFGTYERHRKRFATFEDFVQWYNKVRVHESLDLETPEQVFWLKLREYIFEKAVRLFGW